MRWVGHVACMGAIVLHRGLWCGNLTEGDHLEDLGVDGSVILVARKEIE